MTPGRDTDQETGKDPRTARSARGATGSHSKKRVHLPRRIRPGTRLALDAGRPLRSLVLAHADGEQIAVELTTGTLIRVQLAPTTLEGYGANGSAPDATLGAEERSTESGERPSVLSVPIVVEFTIAHEVTNIDPARPEAVSASQEPVRISRPKRRAVRRLCRLVAAREGRGKTILGSRGPSLAFVDLETSAPSVMLIKVAWRLLELVATSDQEVVLTITWGGTTQILPVVDARCRAAAFAHRPRSLRGDPLAGALGFRPGFVLVGLDRVRGGHVRKVVFGVLPR